MVAGVGLCGHVRVVSYLFFGSFLFLILGPTLLVHPGLLRVITGGTGGVGGAAGSTGAFVGLIVWGAVCALGVPFLFLKCKRYLMWLFFWVLSSLICVCVMIFRMS